MTSFTDPATLIGRTAVDRDGDKIGKIGQVYLDDQSGQPLWVAISTGLFGTKDSFAPLGGATEQDADVRLAVEKDRVKDAPNIENDGHLDEQEQDALFAYYSEYSGSGAGTAGRQDSAPAAGEPAATTGQGTDGDEVRDSHTDSAMTRSEEQVNVGTERVATGRARLRKYVVTENVTQTVPVSHEEVRVEREPITDSNAGAAMDGPDISEDEHEVTLSAERPVVEKETVPVERVRVGTETVTDQQTVSEDVRKEQIELDDESGTADQR